MLNSSILRHSNLRDHPYEFQQLRKDMEHRSSHTNSPSIIDSPVVNTWLGHKVLIVRVELPDIDPKGLNITATSDILTISGSHPFKKHFEGENISRHDTNTNGWFIHTLQLPFQVDTSKVNIMYEKDILQITLGRSDIIKPKRYKWQENNRKLISY